MYQYFNYKLWSVLLAVGFLAGCPSMQVTEPGVQIPNSSEDVDTATYHVVAAGETLYGISVLYGRNYREVANWNGLIPPYALAKGQRLRVDGPNENAVSPSNYDNAGVPVNPYKNTPSTPIPSGSQQTHTVQAGETLYSISRRYGQKVSSLTRWNNINPNSYQLSIGQVLIVSQNGSAPVRPATAPQAKPNRYPPPPSATPNRYPPPQAKPTRYPPPAPNASGSQGYHIVLKGDTMYRIAKHYGFSVSDIAAWNGLQAPYRPLRLGEKLRVSPPDANTVLPTPPAPKQLPPSFGGNAMHTVTTGETVYSIARKYAITVKNLADLNKLVHPYILSIGQKLRISSSGTMIPNTGSLQHVGSSSSMKYTVKPGESFEMIAKKYGIPPATLAAWNNQKAPYNVYPGQILKIAP
ncbi:MAG: LysM peptidoglycan-binding domain-containing protein [Proteobacteria bacterium]|nr:LysM peptidoglycan-binding domain-containing protein [Pseudomonadota bacterium]